MFILALFCLSAFAGGSFPIGPDANLTPGTFCQTPDSYRYPEHIPYCNRNVKTQEKWQVIDSYNSKLGYNITAADRGDFKIDHLIPLCAGGSNEPTNLWPQHKTIYAQTDPLEPLACDKMKSGTLKQAHAAELIMRAKADLSQVPAVLQELESL